MSEDLTEYNTQAGFASGGNLLFTLGNACNIARGTAAFSSGVGTVETGLATVYAVHAQALGATVPGGTGVAGVQAGIGSDGTVTFRALLASGSAASSATSNFSYIAIGE